jgi:hypothetical protein
VAVMDALLRAMQLRRAQIASIFWPPQPASL